MEYAFTNQLLYIKRNVINVLLRHANSEPFKVPVNPELLGVPQYPKLIKSPMDLGTIKTKLDKRGYQTANECKTDFYDIFRNCYIFNEPGSLYVEMALKLENLFKRKMAEMPIPEIYVPESALQAVKLNKIKKNKFPPIPHAPNTTAKHKAIGLVSSDTMKTEPVFVRKRSNSGNSFKDEPSIKKIKHAIDIKACSHILLNLMSKKYHDWNRYFMEPVDVEGLKLHDYCSIVKKPMDFRTVKTKLTENRYHTNIEFAEDIKQIFKNCYLYNPEGHEVSRCGKLLEGVFFKLYQSSFAHTKHSMKQSCLQLNYIDFQPLLQKILKRQSDIDLLNNEIVKRNQEIQVSLDFIKNTDVIKTLKDTFNGKKIPTPVLNKKSDTSLEVAKKEIKPPLLPKPSTMPKCNDIKNDISVPSSIPEPPPVLHKLPENVKCQTPKFIKPNIEHDDIELKHPISNSSKSQLNDIDNGGYMKKTEVERVISPIINNPPPQNNVTVQKSIPIKEIVAAEVVKSTQNTDELNSRLKEIKTWIAGQTDDEREVIRCFISKSEGKNIVQVNLLKLKPLTIDNLFNMMKETMDECAVVDLEEFTNEDRMKLSHDLGILGRRYSENILAIYKKTESVESHDGECEIDFEKMKLVTLHRLREFADKYLMKRKLKRRDDKGDDSDSDSTDSSDTDDSSNSSSDGDCFDNLPQVTNIPGVSKNDEVMKQPNNHVSPINQPTHVVPPKQIVQSIITPTQTRLSDSSDSDRDCDYDSKVDNGSKKLRYAFWNKNANTVKSPAFTPQTKPKHLSLPYPMYSNSTRNQLDESLRQIVQDAQAHEKVKKQEEELRLTWMKEEEEQKKIQMLKMQAINENKKKSRSAEQLKKDQEIIKLKETILADQEKRNLDIPEAIEREDYHQLLCDFEYNIDHNLIMKLVHSEPHKVHL